MVPHDAALTVSHCAAYSGSDDPTQGLNRDQIGALHIKELKAFHSRHRHLLLPRSKSSLVQTKRTSWKSHSPSSEAE